MGEKEYIRLFRLNDNGEIEKLKCEVKSVSNLYIRFKKPNQSGIVTRHRRYLDKVYCGTILSYTMTSDEAYLAFSKYLFKKMMDASAKFTKEQNAYVAFKSHNQDPRREPVAGMGVAEGGE